MPAYDFFVPFSNTTTAAAVGGGGFGPVQTGSESLGQIAVYRRVSAPFRGCRSWLKIARVNVGRWGRRQKLDETPPAVSGIQFTRLMDEAQYIKLL